MVWADENGATVIALFPLRYPTILATACFGRITDTHMHMIGPQMPLHNLGLFLPRQLIEDLPELSRQLPVKHFDKKGIV